MQVAFLPRLGVGRSFSKKLARLKQMDGINRGMIERSIYWIAALLAVMVLVPATAFEVRLPADPSEAERFSAQELTAYLGQMGVDHPDVVFEVGATASNRQWVERELAGRSDEAFFIGHEEQRVRLAGRTPRATLYSVYAFLESQGCRFFAPGPLGEVVPKVVALKLKPGVSVHEPVIGTREIGGGPPPGVEQYDAVDWRVKNRLNRAFALRPALGKDAETRRQLDQAWRHRGGGRQWQWIAHNFGFMFPQEDRWFERHPEYFAIYEGRRRAPGSEGKPYYGGGNLALTNPDVIQHVADYAVQWFNDHPEGEVVPLWPNDGAIYWDESPEAMALGGQNFRRGLEGSMTRRMITFANKVAGRVAERHDASRLLLLPAYANYIEPVPEAQLASNLFVQYCYHGDYAHGPLESEHNAKAVQRMRQWASQANHFGVWEYFLIGDIYETKAKPILLPLVYRVRDTMQFLDGLDTTHYFTQANPVYQTYNPLVFYATARYAWDPSIDADALIEDFCRASFGEEAGALLAEFYISMERACLASDWAPMTYAEVATPSPRVFTPELLEQLEALLAKAVGAKMSADERARYDRVVEAFEATRGAVRVSSVVDLTGEQPWRLQRLPDAYIVNPEGQSIDPQRFAMLVQQAIDTGGGSPALQRTAFRLPRRVEAIERLERGGLRLDVVPGLGGRAIRLIDTNTEWNYFAEGTGDDTLSAVGTRYFNYGGYETYVGRGFAGPGWEQVYEVTDRSPYAITLTAKGEDWRIERTYQLFDKPARLIIKDTLTNTASIPQLISLRTHPQLSLGGDQGEVLLYERAVDTEAWQRTDTISGLHDQIASAPSYSFEQCVWQPALHRGLIWRTSADAGIKPVESYVFLAESRQYFQLERMGPALNLKPGQAYDIQQAITPIIGAVPGPAGQDVAPNAAVPDLVQGEPKEWVQGPRQPGEEDRKAAAFDPDHRLVIKAPSPRIDRGTLACWIRPTSSEGQAGWALSVGNNVNGWLVLTADRKQFGFLAKLGTKPYQQSGEAYVSLSTPWSNEIDQSDWRHVAVSWQVDQDTSLAELVIWVDGKVAEKRGDVRWPASFPAGPLVIGGNSASAKSAGAIELADVLLLNRFSDQDDIKGLMTKPAKADDLSWHLPLQGTTQLNITQGADDDVK